MTTRIQLHLPLSLVLLAGSLPACDWILNNRDDPNHCPDRPGNNCSSDGEISCASDRDCPDDTAVCDVSGARICVQCTPDQHAACIDETPVCIDNACRPCTAHDQCASRVCLADDGGACAAPEDVAYLQEGGTGTECSLARPCGSLATAVNAGARYIKIAAGLVVNSGATTIEGRAITILGDPGAALDRNGDGPLLRVRGEDTHVALRDLTISGATGPDAAAIELEPAGGSASLSLARVTVEGNEGLGLSATGGAVTIARSTFQGNAQGGIDLGPSARFDITNTFIVRNGNDLTSVFGGVRIEAVSAGANRFEFNTVVDNRAAARGVTRGSGVICDIVDFPAANNIIARNRIGASATAPNAQTLGVCTYPTSKIQHDVASLGFASPDEPPFSYKLSEGSAAIDQATTTSPVAIDHEGDPRPRGAQKDIGADELGR